MGPSLKFAPLLSQLSDLAVWRKFPHSFRLILTDPLRPGPHVVDRDKVGGSAPTYRGIYRSSMSSGRSRRWHPLALALLDRVNPILGVLLVYVATRLVRG